MRNILRLALVVLALMAVAAVGIVAYVYSGIYNVAATRQHTAPVYWLLTTALTRSIEVRADDIVVPDLSGDDRFHSGLDLYRQHCSQCHGAPGVAPERFALGMTPLPPPIVQIGRERSAAEIFWAAKHGLKMTGMPGWDFKLSDEEIWNLVAFILAIPTLSPVEYYDLTGTAPNPTEPATDQPLGNYSGDPDRGKVALRQYGCIACHQIEGIVGPETWVGPPLEGIGERKYIAGVLPNSSQNLVRWIRNPQGVDPLTAMPELGVTEKHARDMVAYLYSRNDP
ncbi:c-type cytochrome [Rhodoligotrophos defluvii]|uniref:c-type cytochrome n=1 Tax=Rhodoligotrophos defluvii TaxID=2561934 RepID=UPI0010C9ADB3|nr:c-type cytochrome [Rhodoligotrophos defluvii]